VVLALLAVLVVGALPVLVLAALGHRAKVMLEVLGLLRRLEVAAVLGLRQQLLLHLEGLVMEAQD
jgi:hypothetical protein